MSRWPVATTQRLLVEKLTGMGKVTSCFYSLPITSTDYLSDCYHILYLGKYDKIMILTGL
jgi:hypothetical protein